MDLPAKLPGNAATRRPVVLVAIADALLRWALAEALSDAGFDVQLVDTPEAAAIAESCVAAVVQSRSPDVADVNMLPRLPPLTSSCPVIALTSDDTPETRASLARAGAREVLALPIDLENLVLKVRACANLEQRESSSQP